MHDVVVRSTFRSQNVQKTPFSDHFWKLRCQKSARCCGAKHISKSTCTKHTILGPLLEVDITTCSDHFWTFRCRFVWRAQGIVHLVKSEQHVEFSSSFNYNHHYTHSTTLHYTTTTTTLHYITTLHSTTLRYTPLHFTSLHSVTLHYTTTTISTTNTTTTTTTTLH